MEHESPSERPLEQAGPHPPKAPAPSYAPFLLALGITMLFWGIATSPIMSAGGFVVFAGAIWMWVGEIAKGWRN